MSPNLVFPVYLMLLLEFFISRTVKFLSLSFLLVSYWALTHKRVFFTCPNHEPGRSSPQTHIPFPEYPSYYYHFFYACLSQVVFFPQGSNQNPVQVSPITIRVTFPRHLVHFDFDNRQMLVEDYTALISS